MSRPPDRAPLERAPLERAPHFCDLRICEPLIATLALLIVLLVYGQVLPAPFVPVPRPPSGDAAGLPAPTQVLAIESTPSPSPSAFAAVDSPVMPSTTASIADSSPTSLAPTSAATAAQPASTLTPEMLPTATVPPQEIGTPTPVSSPALTLEPLPTSTEAPTPTQEPLATPTETPSPTDEPTATPESPGWDLARDLVGLWEQEDEDWRYYFDFLEDGRVIVSENGARTYRIEGDQTIVIQMPGEAWALIVRDLSEDRLILEGVFGPSDEFYREEGVPNLGQAMIGLWTDADAEYHPLEFTPGGIALGEFGRGTYRVASSSHVFVECDDPAACSLYREYAQSEDTPLSLRVYEIVEDRMTVLGFGYPEKWTLDRSEGYPTLAADIVGLWEDEFGSTMRFTGAGDLERDGERVGSYEVLSETTLWVTLDGDETAWVIAELDADTMAYTELDIYWEEPWAYSRVE